MASFLEISELHVSLGGNRILDGISVDIAADEVVGVLGVSGSGKTTFLRAVSCVVPWTQGEMRLGDCEMTACTTKGMGVADGNIQIVYQNTNLFQNMTLRRNLTLALERVLGNKPVEAKEKAEHLAAELGIFDKLDRYPDEVSGGEAQRAAIARAMIMEPKVLLLDEVTASLDPISAAQTIDTLDKLRRKSVARPTIIIATHAARFANKYCDRMYFLSNGKFRERINKGELFSHEGSEAFYDYIGALEQF